MKKLLILLLFIPLLSFGQKSNDADALKLCVALQSNNFTTDAEAEDAVNKILSVIGASQKPVLQACSNINNAIAAVYKGQRYILYDRDFMNSLTAGSNKYWSNMFILAHEMGHHINGHSLDIILYASDIIDPKSLEEKRKQELEADEFAGFVLAKLGASLSQTSKVLSNIPRISNENSSTHPSKDKRITSVRIGFKKGEVKKVTVANKTVKTNKNSTSKTTNKEGLIIEEINNDIIKFTNSPYERYFKENYEGNNNPIEKAKYIKKNKYFSDDTFHPFLSNNTIIHSNVPDPFDYIVETEFNHNLKWVNYFVKDSWILKDCYRPYLYVGSDVYLNKEVNPKFYSDLRLKLNNIDLSSLLFVLSKDEGKDIFPKPIKHNFDDHGTAVASISVSAVISLEYAIDEFEYGEMYIVVGLLYEESTYITEGYYFKQNEENSRIFFSKPDLLVNTNLYHSLDYYLQEDSFIEEEFLKAKKFYKNLISGNNLYIKITSVDFEFYQLDGAATKLIDYDNYVWKKALSRTNKETLENIFKRKIKNSPIYHPLNNKNIIFQSEYEFSLKGSLKALDYNEINLYKFGVTLYKF